jgi:hypothetical protein
VDGVRASAAEQRIVAVFAEQVVAASVAVER